MCSPIILCLLGTCSSPTFYFCFQHIYIYITARTPFETLGESLSSFAFSLPILLQGILKVIALCWKLLFCSFPF